MKYSGKILQSGMIMEEDLDYISLRAPQQFLVLTEEQSNDFVHEKNPVRWFMLFTVVVVPLLACCLSSLFPLWICVVLFFVVILIIAFSLWLQLDQMLQCDWARDGQCGTLNQLDAAGLTATVPRSKRTGERLEKLNVLHCGPSSLYEVLLELCKHKHEKNNTTLQNFLNVNEQWVCLARHSLRLIQDMEVVLRGYSLVNGKTPISRLEAGQGVDTAFPRLRLSLLRLLTRCLLSYRLATRTLVGYMLPDDDGDSYYICKVPLHELGSGFLQVDEETHDSAESLFGLNDTHSYSLSSLKTLNDLLMKQLSELLTCLFLILAASTKLKQSDEFPVNFIDVIPLQTSTESVEMLRECYEAHKNVELCREPTRKQMSTISPLRIYLRTLQVQLRAALYKSMELDDMPFDDVTSCYTDYIDDVMRHVDAARDCCLQCEEELQVTNHLPASLSPLPPQSEIQLIDDIMDSSSNDDMEDKVFEAVNDQEVEARPVYPDVDVADEPIRVSSASVIRELRSVLAHATSEEQRRMRKQQLFPSYRVKSSLSADSSLLKRTPTSENVVPDHAVPDTNNIEPGIPACEQQAPVLPETNIDQKSSGEQVDDQNLRFYKKPSLPGRLPFRKRRTDLPQIQSSYCNSDESSSGCSRNNVECAEEEPAWTRGLGIGFSSNLAMQAVDIARKRTSFITRSRDIESVTYGSDSLDES